MSLDGPGACLSYTVAPLLGGSWVVISRVISRVTLVMTYIRGLIAPLITTHEPPSTTHSAGILAIILSMVASQHQIQFDARVPDCSANQALTS